MLFRSQVAPVTYIGRYPVLSAPISHTLELMVLLAVTLALLYAPKFFAYRVLLRDPAAVEAHGGQLSVLRSFLLECLFSTLLAPVVMLSHTWFVLCILSGSNTSWGAQQRDDRALPLGFVARMLAPHTLIGLAATVALYVYLPDGFWWFAPLLAGLVLAIPLVRLSSSIALGQRALSKGLFRIPGEGGGMKILDRVRALIEQRQPKPAMLAAPVSMDDFRFSPARN